MCKNDCLQKNVNRINFWDQWLKFGALPFFVNITFVGKNDKILKSFAMNRENVTWEQNIKLYASKYLG